MKTNAQKQKEPTGTGKKLRGEIVEVLNRYEFLPELIKSGFIPYVPEFDVGVDFLLYREVPRDREPRLKPTEQELLLKVQAKGRLYMKRKYIQRDIWMAFPDKPYDSNSDKRKDQTRKWFFCPHDLIVAHVPETMKATKSWKAGSYSIGDFKTSKSKKDKGFDKSFLQSFEMPAIIARLSKGYVDQLRRKFASKW